MAGIFKSLDKSDVRITPFRTHKLWSENLSYNKIVLTGSMSITSSFYHLQAPYATQVYTTYPVSPYYFVNDNEIVSYEEVDSDTFDISFRSSQAVTLDDTKPLVANKYISGILDDNDSNGPSRVLCVISNNNSNETEILQLDFELTSLYGAGGYTLPITGSLINRIDYYPFTNAGNMLHSFVLVSHNSTGGGSGLIGILLDPNNKNMLTHWDIAYDDPAPPLPGLPGSGLDYRGDYYLAIPSAHNSSRILAVYKRDGVLTSSNIELEALPASASYTTFATLGGVGDHTTTGVLDVVSSNRKAFFTLKNQNNIYVSSFDISLMNCLSLGATRVVRLLGDKDDVRYDASTNATQFMGTVDNGTNVVAVLEDGTILSNIKADSTNAQFSYDVIDARQYVGAGSLVTNATINKNIDLISSGSASLLYVWVEPVTKGKSSMFVVNLDTEEVYDPIHVGFISTTTNPLFGSQQSGSSMFTAENRISSVLGINQSRAEINPTTGITSRYLYKFDVQ